MTLLTVMLVLAAAGAQVFEWRRERSIVWLGGASLAIALLVVNLQTTTVIMRVEPVLADALLAIFAGSVSAHAIGLLDEPLRRTWIALLGAERYFNLEIRSIVRPYADLIASYPEHGSDQDQHRWRRGVEREGAKAVAALERLAAPSPEWEQVARGYATVYSWYLADLRSGMNEHAAAVKDLGDSIKALHADLQSRI